MPRIVVATGPSAGETFTLEGDTVIGRNPAECQVVLADDDQVSRQHARIAPQGGGWVLRDLGSANGTWLIARRRDRRRLTSDYQLKDGDQFELGTTRVTFSAAGEGVARAAAAAGAGGGGSERARRYAVPILGVAAGAILSVIVLVVGFVGPGTSPCNDRAAADQIRPSTVQIYALDDAGKQKSAGSGFVLRNDGYVMTNKHVIYDEQAKKAQQKLVVVLVGQERELPAQVVKFDDVIDLALIKAEGIPNLKQITWGRAQDLRDGDRVVAAGFPIPFEQAGRTLGAVTFTFGGLSALREFQGAQYLQHNADVNPGNSGGPLVNACGAVVGVNSEVAYIPGQPSRAPGINFAISATEARRLADQWLPLR
jgi:S1-C subfamily serine protease